MKKCSLFYRIAIVSPYYMYITYSNNCHESSYLSDRSAQT